MNRKTRILTTLDFREPDRVPLTEMSIDTPHLESISGKRFDEGSSLQTPTSADRGDETRNVDLIIECYQKIGFDMVPSRLSAPDGWTPKTMPEGMIADEWGRVLAYDEKCKAWVPFQTIFKNMEDFDEFPFPDENAPGRIYALEHMKKRVGDKMAIAAFIRDPFAHAWEMFTPTNFVRWLYEKPSFVDRVIQLLTNFNIEMIKRIGEVGVDLIISGGDYAEKKGPMTPIDFFRRTVFPNLKKQVEAAHRSGVKFIKHTDGNINILLDDLTEIVDGLHSLDPSAGMDIGYIKEKYQDNLILIGNVAVESLCLKTTDQVKEETKDCLRRAASGGGYILSSSNSWYTNTKLENCLAMVEATRKFGIYPIKIP